MKNRENNIQEKKPVIGKGSFREKFYSSKVSILNLPYFTANHGCCTINTGQIATFIEHAVQTETTHSVTPPKESVPKKVNELKAHSTKAFQEISTVFKKAKLPCLGHAS